MGPLEFLTDHTYRTVFLGTGVIGVVAGAIGVFAYLRRQSMISDVIAHSALPGALGAFLIAVTALGIDGRSLPALLIGAVLTGTAAALLANLVTHVSTIRIDTAMAVVLTLFFGIGMLLLRVISDGPYPGKGGIGDYLFGNASVITTADLRTSAVVGGAVLLLVVLFWKEFAVRTFDPAYASGLGFSARIADPLIFTAIVIATVIGVKAVGLVLMVALVITPAAAARQWVASLPAMVLLSGMIGGLSAGAGTYLSIAVIPAPTGPMIVLVTFAVMVVSLLAAPRRSLITRALARRALRRQLQRELQ